RARRQLSRHHGLYPRKLVLVRQSGAFLHPARQGMADRVLRRARDLEHPRLPCALADPYHLISSDPTILVGTDPPRASDLGVDRQSRAAVRLRHDPTHGDREVLYDLRFLALVGGSSLGRAVLRILRGGNERLLADGARAGLAAARRAVGLSGADPDLPRGCARHRASSLLGGRTGPVG